MDEVIETLVGIAWIIALLILFAIAMFGFYYSINGMARCLTNKPPCEPKRGCEE